MFRRNDANAIVFSLKPRLIESQFQPPTSMPQLGTYSHTVETVFLRSAKRKQRPKADIVQVLGTRSMDPSQPTIVQSSFTQNLFEWRELCETANNKGINEHRVLPRRKKTLRAPSRSGKGHN